MSDPEPTRESYHHGDLRQAILTAACHHLLCENAESLSLRALAREIGVSQTAPYRHFDSKNALFAGIATWGFRILGTEMQQALSDGQSSMQAILALGQCYLNFSVDHAEKYQLFFDSSLVEFDEYPELQEASAMCFNLLLAVIRQGKVDGLYVDRDDEEIAAIIWAGLHGMASLVHMDYKREEMTGRPVGKAVKFLAEQQDVALGLLLRAVLK